MKNIKAIDLYNNICEKFLSPRWLKTNSFSKAIMYKHIRNDKFPVKLNTMVINHDYSCQAVLELCNDILDEVAEKNTPEDWLSYFYHFALAKSFPNAVDTILIKELEPIAYFYLDLLRIISQFQKDSHDGTWLSKYSLTFLSKAEEVSLEDPTEYNRFISSFEHDYVYEMMKLNKEVTGHNTIDHVCGVHYLAMFISRQLKRVEISIDLGRVSGAAAGHDIGKYGCRKNEYKRVPYLHYYYTDQWFKIREMPHIGNIALNHSTWDLELENLPLESLVLIYSDFRVKNKVSDSNKFSMEIYDLAESFDVILSKLDNVDETKKKRYTRVYAKLKDFEDFLLDLGVNVDIHSLSTKQSGINLGIETHDYALMNSNDVLQHLKYISINHNINLMYLLRDEHSLYAILELARSEKDWRNLREYLRIFKEYSTYLTQKQKIIMIKFLYEYLIHPEDDIRRYCAELIGYLISIFDEDYRKEVPENVDLYSPDISSVDLLNQYIQLFLVPSHEIISLHQEWIGTSFSIMISSLFKEYNRNTSLTGSKLTNDYISLILNYYSKDYYKYKNIEIYLLETIKHIPINVDDSQFKIISNFLFSILENKISPLRVAALEVIYHLLQYPKQDIGFTEKIKNYLLTNLNYSEIPAENYLNGKIIRCLNLNTDNIKDFNKLSRLDFLEASDLYLSNLKTATDWVTKKVQIDILLEFALQNPKERSLHTVIHFCNLLKVSASDRVRNRAGEAVLKMMPKISFEERNEVAIELLRSLELEGHQFSEYIPYYLGQLILYLPPIELDEIIDDLSQKAKKSNADLTSLLLKTIGLTIANYPNYTNRFEESQGVFNDRLVKMLGILINGLVNYNRKIRQVAFRVLGRDIFGSKRLSLDEKHLIFQFTSKKILTLLTDTKESSLLFLVNSVGLNHIYRFISDYIFYKGSFKFEAYRKVAFFPGTFDAFSISHKEIAKAVRDLGYEVYLAIDEFSWSKQTLPHILRKNIIKMSIADELNIYLYPNDYPTNIANPKDLKTLKDNFPNSEVNVVIGSDVIINSSCYHTAPEPNSIHTFPHIIVERNSEDYDDDQNNLQVAIQRIKGNTLILSLPEQYEDISSTQIRNYIDQNRDISSLIDPLAQKYIIENGFYRRQPQYKSLTKPITMDIEVIDEFSIEILSDLAWIFKNNYDEALNKLIEFSSKPSAKLIAIRDLKDNGRIIGFSAHHWVRLNCLFNEFQDSTISDYIRENSTGRICVIDCIIADRTVVEKNLEQIVTTETLAYCMSKDYEYSVFKNMFEFYRPKSIYETLKLQGFIKLASNNNPEPIYTVNMSAPSTLNLDIENIIKEPYRSTPLVQETIENTRKKLQKSLVELYPGHLLLSIDRDILYQTLIKKICKENNVPTIATNPRVLGKYMCVPFGSNMLNRYIIPNTVTKALHMEKLFSSHMKDYIIGPFPNYPDLEKQVKMLNSFNRPMILVDDILHKGYRINALDPLLNKQNVSVQKIVVGVLSARGKELMDRQKRSVDSAYYIPKLRSWFTEGIFYPFFGGDTLWRGADIQRYIIPSVNLILPYTSPTFLKSTSNDAIYNFSKTCIENSLELLLAIEKVYHDIHDRNLTLASLGEVLASPRCPDHGENMYYDLSLLPSSYLYNDLELLSRLEYSILNKKDRRD